MIYTFFEVATVLFACLLVHIFFNGWFGARAQKRSKMALFMLAYFLLHSVVTLLPLNPALRAVISTFLVIGIAAALYETTKPSAIYSAFLYMALAVLSEYLCLVFMQMLGFDANVLMVEGNSRAIYLFIAKTVQFIVVLIAASVLRKNRAALTAKQVAPLIPCLIVSIHICIVFFRVFPYHENGLPMMLIIALLGLLYVNGIIIICTQSIKNNALEIEEQKLAGRHYEMQKQYYHKVIKDRDETRALWHDLKKHVTALEVLVESGDTQSAKNEYEQIRQAFDDLGSVVDVENSTLNAILYHNINRVKSNNVHVNLEAQASREFSISAVDLSVIIGNTFDNAIEECLLITETQKDINVVIIQKHHMLFYEISNPCLQVPHRKAGNFHGYGLRNVRRCVEKYGGSMEIESSDNQYKVSIRLNCAAK